MWVFGISTQNYALIGYLYWVYSNNDNFFFVSFHIGDTPGRVRSRSTVFKLQAIGPLKTWSFECPCMVDFIEKASVERLQSRGQHLCNFIGTKESVFMKKEFNSHRIGLGHQHGRCFIVLEHQSGHHDIMQKCSLQVWFNKINVLWKASCAHSKPELQIRIYYNYCSFSCSSK